VTPSAGDAASDPRSLDRVGIVDREDEPSRREVVAPLRVSLSADADRHRDAKCPHAVSEVQVEGMESATDRGEEQVVHRHAGGVRGALHVGEGHVEHGEVAIQPSAEQHG
jgi:hypothetical protein